MSEPVLPTPEPNPAAAAVVEQPPDATIETPGLVAEASADAEPVEEAEPAEGAAPAETPRRKPSGAVAELIALRREKQQLQARVQQFESNPVLQRLTPDMQQAALEGRLTIQPPQGSREAEERRLTAVADKFGLYRTDAQGQQVPDLDTAKRVAAGIRDIVKEEIAPVRYATLADKANANVHEAVRAATAAKYPDEAVNIIKAEFHGVLSNANGAEMLSQPEVAMRVWDAAVGRAVREGAMTVAQGAKALAQGAPAMPAGGHPAVVLADATGRRGNAASIQLSPQLQSVYAAHGIDPAKTKAPKVDQRGHMELENR